MINRKLALISIFSLQATIFIFLLAGLIGAADAVPATAGTGQAGWGYIGAGIAVGLACIGSGSAVARIGSAGIGAVTEKPELMGRTLVFLGLAEGIAIYGLIIAIIILNKI
jgi:V/A-type H+/Na+-transporting ATPase subunit K